MRKLVLVTILSVMCNSLTALASCEAQKREYEEFRKLCEDLTTASQVAQIGGGILGVLYAIPTFGISLAVGGLAGGVPGLAANNACRIRDEKKHNLDECESRHSERLQNERESESTKIQQFNRLLEEQNKRRNEIESINYRANERRSHAREHFSTSVRELLHQLTTDGYNLNDAKIKEVITSSRRDLELQLHKTLARLERQRRKALADLGESPEEIK